MTALIDSNSKLPTYSLYINIEYNQSICTYIMAKQATTYQL